MKIKTKPSDYDKVIARKRPEHRKPLRPLFLLQILIRILALIDLISARFTFTKHGMEKIGKKSRC